MCTTSQPADMTDILFETLTYFKTLQIETSNKSNQDKALPEAVTLSNTELVRTKLRVLHSP